MQASTVTNGDHVNKAAKPVPAQRRLFLAIVMICCTVGIVAVQRSAAIGEEALPPRLLADFPRLLPDTSEPGLPIGWQRAWSPSARDSGISDAARATRVGAHLADLDLAVEARRRDITWEAYYGVDPVAVERGARNSAYVAAFAHEIVASLVAMPEARRAAAAFRRVEQRGRDRATIVSTEVSDARFALPREHMTSVAIGSWLESVRIAAYRGDTAFFNDPRSRAMAITVVHIDAARPARHTLQQLRAIVKAPPLDLDAAGRAATAALRLLVEA